jgi:probable phosphoglycerate mutase
MSLFPDEPSSSDFIYAHCDGGSRGNPGPSGFGAVITDGKGQTLAELSEFLGIRTNNFAEYSGLLAVLGWALEHGHRRVKLVSDSELMVKQIQGRYKVNSPDLKPLWQQARERIAKLEAFEISHALRHKNKAADALANQAMDRGMRRTALVPAKSAVEAAPRAAAAPRPAAIESAEPPPAHPGPPQMLRGFTRNGAIQLLGGHTLPDGIFVKIIRE